MIAVTSRAFERSRTLPFFALFTSSFALLALPARADAPSYTLDVKAEATSRLLGTHTSGVDVGLPDPKDPSRIEAHKRLEHRLRTSLGTVYSRTQGFVRGARAEFEGDAFDGAFLQGPRDPEPLLAADPMRRETTGLAGRDHFRIRKLLVGVTTMAGRVTVGRQLSQWGLGLIAQAGVDEPMQFGFKREGSLVDRVQYALNPFAMGGDALVKRLPLFLSVAWDRVVRDDLLDREVGDRGTNWVGAALWQGDAVQAGVYTVSREQKDAAGNGIRAKMIDGYASGKIALGDWTIGGSTEWAFVRGDTDLFRTSAHPGALALTQQGGVVRLDASRSRLAFRLEGGYASADTNPFDGDLRNFGFARDYRVGLVLFGEMLRRQTAVAAWKLADPRFAAAPPVGYERFASGGAVTQALYLNPTVRGEPIPGLTLLGGVLLARSPADVVDPFSAFASGGAPAAYRGARGARGLGVEVDGAVRYRWDVLPRLSVACGVDGGVLLPGPAFDDARGRAASPVTVFVGHVMLTGRL